MNYSKENTVALNDIPASTITKKYLSLTEASEYTGLSRWTLWRYAKDGKLPKIKLGSGKSGKVLFDREGIDLWLQKNTITVVPAEENL